MIYKKKNLQFKIKEIFKDKIWNDLTSIDLYKNPIDLYTSGFWIVNSLLLI